MKTQLRKLIAGVMMATALSPNAQEILESPDGSLRLTVGVRDVGEIRSALAYSVAWHGRELVQASRLGLAVRGAPPITGNLQIVQTTRDSWNRTWKPVYGERRTVHDAANEMCLELREAEKPGRVLRLRCRAYDQGIAFAYELPDQAGVDQLHISGEQTEFRFAEDCRTWATYSAQGEYREVPLSKIKPGCERPLTIRVDDHSYVALAEAALVDCCRTKLGPLADGSPGVLTFPDASGTLAKLPWRSSWRVIMVAASPGELLENNDLILNLNAPCEIEDTSWIRPGKVIREVTLTTRGGMACVDFARTHGLDYVEYDAGWYGHESSDKADARAVSVDPKRSRGPLDLPAVISYARQHGVGIILYVNRRALERQLDEILPLYRQWGVAGVKYGFVQVGSQRWTAWLHEAVRKAAAQHLMVDIHDEYRPTGYSRTYPNLMTQEGIRGDETKPSNRLTLTILFTRMLAGAGDNTVCYYNERVDANACHAYQLAKAVCIYSPWQFLYWYDRPLASAGPNGKTGPGIIGEEPELEFFAAMPTVWDDTKVLHGAIGEYAVIARRSGQDWFVGCMNGDTARELPVSLSFLDPGRTYAAHVYSHDPATDTRTHVRIDRCRVRATTTLPVKLMRRGGTAIRLTPATDADRYPEYTPDAGSH